MLLSTQSHEPTWLGDTETGLQATGVTLSCVNGWKSRQRPAREGRTVPQVVGC